MNATAREGWNIRDSRSSTPTRRALIWATGWLPRCRNSSGSPNTLTRPGYAYKGPVGIDMMLCQEGICPCVEINWRMTMGRVATMLNNQGKYGRLVLEYVYGHYSAEVEAFG